MEILDPPPVSLAEKTFPEVQKIMSPSNLTAIATIIVGFIAPYVTEYVQSPEIVQFLLDGLHKVILALAVGVFAWVGSTPYNERVTRIVSAVIRYVEDKRDTSKPDDEQNLELRKLAIEIIKGEIGASSLGWRGLILKVPVLGQWLIGRMVDGAASGVKTVAAAKTGAAALKSVKTRNAS